MKWITTPLLLLVIIVGYAAAVVGLAVLTHVGGWGGTLAWLGAAFVVLLITGQYGHGGPRRE